MSHADVIKTLEKKLESATRRRKTLTDQQYLSSFEERRVKELGEEIEKLEDRLSLERRQIPLLDEEL